MNWEQIYDIGENGHLMVGGADTVELVKQYGTPLYVMNEDLIRSVCRMYQTSIQKYYQGNGLPLYASKAFSCKAAVRLAAEEGFGLDVVSGGELYTALSVGFDPSKIYFHGNNKTMDELSYALDSNVGHIVVDNLYELECLNRIAGEKGKKALILLRIKPGVDAHTHEFIMTGQIDSKFGLSLETSEAMDGVKKALEYPNIDLKGVHCHIGSQIFDITPFRHTARIMVNFMGLVKKKTGLVLSVLNLGGGFGIRYVEQDDPVPYDQYMREVSGEVFAAAKANDIPAPFILIEPGRSIVGEAGLTLYTIGAIKDIPGIRTYLSVDGGMSDNPRYALYQASYDAIVANKADKPREMNVTIAGKCCESGDLIQENIAIQKAQSGDVLAVLSTGAYNYSMASNYNRIPRPAVVFVSGGKTKLAVRRETYADIVRNDL